MNPRLRAFARRVVGVFVGGALLQCGAGSSPVRTTPAANDRDASADARANPDATDARTMSPSAGVVSLGAGSFHTCAAGHDGALRCWGQNDDGQLGNGTVEPAAAPVVAAVSGQVLEVVAGEAHTCARTRDATVHCWGDNLYGQLGDGAADGARLDRPTPAPVAGLTAVVELAAGGHYTCARRSDGSVWCWGGILFAPSRTPAHAVAPRRSTPREALARLTTVTPQNLVDDTPDTRATTRPTEVSGVRDAVALAAGDTLACALVQNGSVRCWGGGAGEPDSSVSVVYDAPTDNGSVAAGPSWVCAQRKAGAPWCSGRGFGFLGRPESYSQRVQDEPALQGLGGVVFGRTGAVMMCGLEAGDGVRCQVQSVFFGADQLTVPVVTGTLAVPGGAVQLAAGSSHVCARTRDGAVFCWGSNDRAQLGDGGTPRRKTPYAVPSLEGVTGLALGGQQSCALSRTGAVACWGRDRRLLGGEAFLSAVPTERPELTGAAGLALGPEHACLWSAAGAVQCWGLNDQGQLGRPAHADHPLDVTREDTVPGVVAGLAAAVEVGVGSRLTCARLTDGTVACWGLSLTEAPNGNGVSPASEHPTRVAGLAHVAQLVVGSRHACARMADGSVKCWGENYLDRTSGRGAAFSPRPVAVPGVSGAVHLAVQGGLTCAALSDGRVLCWGYHEVFHAEANASRRTVFALPGLSDVTRLALGPYHACAVTKTGAVSCWGRNYYRSLGREGTGGLEPPAPVGDLGPMVDVAVGESHTCAQDAAGQVWCWGRGDLGQTGDGTVPFRAEPTRVGF